MNNAWQREKAKSKRHRYRRAPTPVANREPQVWNTRLKALEQVEMLYPYYYMGTFSIFASLFLSTWIAGWLRLSK